jgi:hypothetical protein
MPIEIHSPDEIEPFENKIRANANVVRDRVQKLISKSDGLAFLAQIKFEQIGCHPLNGSDMNLVEQTNLSWTYLVSLQATRFLFERHPEAKGYQLYLGTDAGTDIVSLEPNCVAAETFAATNPHSNRKLAKDVLRLMQNCPEAQNRYVFFAAPNFEYGRKPVLETVPGIEVWSIPFDVLSKIAIQSLG